MLRLHVLGNQAVLAARIHRRCRPLAGREVGRWERRAAAIPDPQLRQQALASLARKRFHCEGGAVYAAIRPEADTALAGAIVAFQSLVDFLDNLSDRCGPRTGGTLALLHTAVDDALNPGAPLQDYYGAGRPPDGGYLGALVTETQQRLAALPDYPGAVAAACRHLGALYSELQVRKHLPTRVEREAALTTWLQPLEARYPPLRWWELAAACGSTLGIFALWAAAASPGGGAAAPALGQAYFPWIGALHILLDYFIDQAEDRAGGDLNFVSYYPHPAAAEEGLARILAEALRQACALPGPALHEMVVRGLPGLYLSDPKVRQQRLGPAAARLVRTAGPLGTGAYWYCRLRPPGR